MLPYFSSCSIGHTSYSTLAMSISTSTSYRRDSYTVKEVNLWWVEGNPDDVRVACSWYDWKVVRMKKRRGGVWHLALKLGPGIYEFKFIVDGMWRLSNYYDCSKKLDDMLKNNIIAIEYPKMQASGKQGCTIT